MCLTIKAPHCAHRPCHARVFELGCSAPFASTLSVLFHEIINMECSHLNTPFSFISPPMWDKVPLSHYFNIQCFKHQTLSIDISFILAPFSTRFSLLRRFSNIERKSTNRYRKSPSFLLFISSPKIGKCISYICEKPYFHNISNTVTVDECRFSVKRLAGVPLLRCISRF
ncbi:hypothetical protein Hanom_Chr06g00564691 [Helianthus anomalus]